MEDFAFAINGAPKLDAIAVDPHDDLIQVLEHISTWVCLPQRLGVGEAKLNRSAANRFVGNVDPALG